MRFICGVLGSFCKGHWNFPKAMVKKEFHLSNLRSLCRISKFKILMCWMANVFSYFCLIYILLRAFYGRFIMSQRNNYLSVVMCIMKWLLLWNCRVILWHDLNSVFYLKFAAYNHFFVSLTSLFLPVPWCFSQSISQNHQALTLKISSTILQAFQRLLTALDHEKSLNTEFFVPKLSSKIASQLKKKKNAWFFDSSRVYLLWK